MCNNVIEEVVNSNNGYKEYIVLSVNVIGNNVAGNDSTENAHLGFPY